MVALAVSGLAKRYGRVAALRGISFGIEAGEVFGYLGPNGAGKTTTLRIIMGLVRPDEGEVRSPGLARIGYLPGELHLYDGMTAGRVLEYFARFRPERTPSLRESLLDALGMDGAALSRRVKTLSHGTRQKLGLVIALQHDPDIWLLDEPTIGLDPLVQQGFRQIVRDGAGRGRAILLSSHVLPEVESVCRRVGILRAGELVTVDSIAELRHRTVRRLRVVFRDTAAPDLSGIPGVVQATADGREADLRIRGDVNPIIRRLASFEIEQLVFPEPELEDIFLGYYDRSAGKASRA